MLYKINNILEGLFGIRIKKTEKEFRNKATYKHPLYVEFVGTSGVGKSFLSRSLLKEEEGWWFSENYVYKKRIKNADFLRLLNENGLYQELSQRRMNEILKYSASPTDKLISLKNVYQCLRKDLLIEHLNQDELIVSDEGLVQYFALEIEKLIDEDRFKEELTALFKNRIVIYCYARPETITERIQKRKEETGRIVARHETRGAGELLELTAKESAEYRSAIESLKKWNLPVLMVDTEGSLKHNLEGIKEFIKTNHPSGV